MLWLSWTTIDEEAIDLHSSWKKLLFMLIKASALICFPFCSCRRCTHFLSGRWRVDLELPSFPVLPMEFTRYSQETEKQDWRAWNSMLDGHWTDGWRWRSLCKNRCWCQGVQGSSIFVSCLLLFTKERMRYSGLLIMLLVVYLILKLTMQIRSFEKCSVLNIRPNNSSIYFSSILSSY